MFVKTFSSNVWLPSNRELQIKALIILYIAVINSTNIIHQFTITKKRLCKYVENFTSKKTEKFQIKTSDIFHISAQNIDYGYSLELPQRGSSNEYPQSMICAQNIDYGYSLELPQRGSSNEYPQSMI